VAAASDAFKTWSNTTVLTRQRFIFEFVTKYNLPSDTYLRLNRLQRLIRENADSLVTSMVLEQGKTVEGQINDHSNVSGPGTSIQMRGANSRGDSR
jgi:acyl-CoA reductase-like NAD-dependent aldehyde dehydrogenase